MQIPLLLELSGQPVLCIGAGPVAAGKVTPMLQAGAVVTVVAPTVHHDLAAARHVLRRPYAPGDVRREPRPRLVVAGTGIAAVDDVVASEAESMGIWCLRIAGQSPVTVPAVVRRGEVVVALTTGAPALTRRLRTAVESVVDDRWALASVALAGLRRDADVREALAGVDPAERRQRWHHAVDLALGGATTAATRAVLVGEGA